MKSVQEQDKPVFVPSPTFWLGWDLRACSISKNTINKDNIMKLIAWIAVAVCSLNLGLFAEQTLSIIKPDAVKNHYIGSIVSRFEDEKLNIDAIKMTRLTKEQAEKFYAEHRERPFFNDLVEFMTSGPIVAIVLEGNDAIAKNRKIMGATDPKKADKGTLRADFAESMTRNAVHGSDSPEAAQREIQFFFKTDEIFPKK
jgi:nucleoside diphosphate kinase